MMDDELFAFAAPVWRWSGEGAWYFLTLPVELTEELNARYGYRKRAWASLPVEVTIGDTVWQTSLFNDSKRGAYLLPLKASVRKQEHLDEDTVANVTLRVRGI